LGVLEVEKNSIQCLISRFGETFELGVVIWENGPPAPNMKKGSLAFWRKETNIIFALFSLAEDHQHALPYLYLWCMARRGVLRKERGRGIYICYAAW
jgi:hypothetical protein